MPKPPIPIQSKVTLPAKSGEPRAPAPACTDLVADGARHVQPRHDQWMKPEAMPPLCSADHIVFVRVLFALVRRMRCRVAAKVAGRVLEELGLGGEVAVKQLVLAHEKLEAGK